MDRADTLIKNALAVLTPQGAIPNADIAIRGGRITDVGELPDIQASEVIDAYGCVVSPGLINAHTHLPMTLFRGYADDYRLDVWLNDHIFPAEARLDARSVYCGAMLGIAEALSSGTTSVSDMYYFSDAIAEACAESGIRANLSRSIVTTEPDFDIETDSRAQEARALFERWHGHDAGRIKIDMSIHAEYTSHPRVWEQVAHQAQKLSAGIQLHLSETQREHAGCFDRYNLSPAMALERAGVFEAPVACAHCVWLSDQDMDILKRHGASAVHNPVSNLKLASGVMRLPELIKRGVNVALGTDGAASNNSLNLFKELKLAALLHKERANDAAVMPARQAFELATINGACAQGREGQCGALIPGADADLILIDFTAPHLRPCHDPISNLVYSARGSDVKLTMVKGRTLYKDGRFMTVDLERVYSELNDYALPRLFPAGRQPFILRQRSC